MRFKETITVLSTEKLNNSVNGNPKLSIVCKVYDDWAVYTATTSTNAGWVYGLSNIEGKRFKIEGHETAKGKIILDLMDLIKEN